MGRRFRKTEITETVTVDSRQNGQYMHSNMFCVNCHGLNKHYPECTRRRSYAIPATAEVPPKNASKRIWKIFKEQFVFARPVGYWFNIERSWWYRSIYLKELEKRGYEMSWGFPVRKQTM